MPNCMRIGSKKAEAGLGGDPENQEQVEKRETEGQPGRARCNGWRSRRQ